MAIDKNEIEAFVGDLVDDSDVIGLLIVYRHRGVIWSMIERNVAQVHVG